jgi:hypothetical protein
MAGAIQILLKLVGDASQAVRSFNQTTDAAKKTEEQTKRTQSSMSTFLKSVPGMTTAAGVALAAVDNALGQMQNTLSDILAMRAQREAALAGTPREEAAALVDTVRGAAQKRRLSLTNPATWTPQNILADYGSPLGSLLGLGGRARRQRQDELLEQQLVTMSPEDLQRIAPYVPQARELLPEVRRAAAYRQGQTTIVNNYPKGVNPRAVDQNMSRYERVNGRSRRP